MALNFFSKSDFEKLLLKLPQKGRKGIIIFSNSPVYYDRNPRKFSVFVLAFGFVLFFLLMAFQFWANVMENPQILSSKPNFHFVTSIPFCFEITLVVVGILLFFRFLLVNYSKNKPLKAEIKDKIEDLDNDNILIYVNLSDNHSEVLTESKKPN